MITRRFAFCVLLVVSFALVSVSSVSAQSGFALVRFGVYTDPSDVLITDTTSNEFFLATNPNPVNQDVVNADAEYATLVYDLVTKYGQFAPSELEFTISDAPSGGGNTSTETVTVEAGNVYTIIKHGINSPAIVINETVLEEESPLGDGENSVTVITRTADGAGGSESSFRFTLADNDTPTPLQRFEFSGYFRAAVGVPVRLERLDPATGSPIAGIVIPYLPSTNVIINGDALGSDLASAAQFSTPLTVLAWLQGINNMANPPFTFNNFINTATTGGFAGALEQCQNYMWNVFTDEAYEALDSAVRDQIVGRNTSLVMDASVLQPATSAPWLLGQTRTRGGTPVTYANPFAASTGSVTAAHSTPIGVNGDILLTISTTGNAVQNIINLVNVVPFASDGLPGAIFYTPPYLLDAAIGD